jgi:hypothetical protein
MYYQPTGLKSRKSALRLDFLDLNGRSVSRSRLDHIIVPALGSRRKRRGKPVKFCTTFW